MKIIRKAKLHPWLKVGGETNLGEATPWLRAYVQHYKHPVSGKEYPFSLFTHKDTSIVVPITTNGNIVLTRQWMQGIEDISIELPGGAHELSDDEAMAAAKRELLAETGYEAREIKKIFKYSIHTRQTPNWVWMYAGLDCQLVSEPRCDETEIIEVIEVTADELWEIIDKGEVVDAATPIGAYRAAHCGYIPFPVI